MKTTTKTRQIASGQYYVGKIVSAPKGEEYAFIGLETVTKADGSDPGLGTTQDIFLHQDECRENLEVGLTLEFEVIADDRRNAGAWRARAAVEHLPAEIMPKDSLVIPGFGHMVPIQGPLPRELAHYVSARHPAHIGAKEVPSATVEQVAANRPMPEIPRDEVTPQTPEEKENLLRAILFYVFPMMRGFGSDFRVVNPDDAELDQLVARSCEDQLAMGMQQAAQSLQSEVESFKNIRGVLKVIWDEDLVRRDAIIPIKYLPDLFMAVPVWHHWLPVETDVTRENDPRVHEETKYFCDLFPNQRWMDTFQMFNRRTRPIQTFKGDLITPTIARRLRVASRAFDHLVIMTPYHDIAGQDWQNLDWIRLIDPYVVGFKNRLNVMVVLGRFSDAGTFPLHQEMVGDTIEFLRKNKERLSGFNTVKDPNWYEGRTGPAFRNRQLGNDLIARTDELLQAFDNGYLFDWLRGEDRPRQPNHQPNGQKTGLREKLFGRRSG